LMQAGWDARRPDIEHWDVRTQRFTSEHYTRNFIMAAYCCSATNELLPQWLERLSADLNGGLHAHRLPRSMQAALLRDVFGNPFRPTSTRSLCGLPYCANGPQLSASRRSCVKCRSIATWNDEAVPRIAQHIYDKQAWESMGILHDALLDAGCDNEGILAHCRGSKCRMCGGKVWGPEDDVLTKKDCDGHGPFRCLNCNGLGSLPHVRGCWVVDLLLGKELGC
jgi:hypothetical protein